MEIVTYASAGILTTREFIAMSAWELWQDQQLRTRFVTSDLLERESILKDLLRRTPVIQMLYRRMGESADLAGCPVHQGELVRIDVKAANHDPAVWAGDKLPRGVQPEGLAFGAGAHRCPGGPLAIREAAILLHDLLKHPNLTVLSEPVISRNENVKGYEVRELRVRLA